MPRVFREHTFGPDDETVTVVTPMGFTLGKIAVYGRITSASGVASLRVFGAFESDAADAGLSSEVQTIDLNDIGAGDTFKLTYNAHETGTITYSYPYGQRDISELGDPDFIGQQLPVKADTQDQSLFTGGSYLVTGAAYIEPYSPPEDTGLAAQIQSALVGLVDFDEGDVTVEQVSSSVYTVTFGGNYALVDPTAITITSAVGFTPTGVTQSTQGGTVSEEVTDVATLGSAISQVVVDHENRYPYLILAYNGNGDAALTAEAYVVFY